MDVELNHHYGWKRYSTDVDNLPEAAYQAVRQTHGFLTDENHTYDAGERSTKWGGKEIKFQSVRVYRGECSPAYSGPPGFATDYWFSVEYRDPTGAA